METTIKHPKTLVEAVRYFSDLDVAHSYFTKAIGRMARSPARTVVRPVESTSPTIGNRSARANIRSAQFTVKVGTIMEDSPMSLDKWAVAFWLEANAKNSISSYELHRAAGITQEVRMVHAPPHPPCPAERPHDPEWTH